MILQPRHGLAAVLLAGLIAGPVASVRAGDDGDEDHDDDIVLADRVVLELADGASIEDVAELPPGVVVELTIETAGLALLAFPAPVDVTVLESLEADPAIDDADWLVDIGAGGGQTQGVFYDAIESEYREQYTWTRLGLDGVATEGGAGVVVAVVDTGVDADHPDLAGSVVPGDDLVDGDGDPDDSADGNDSDGDGLVDEFHGHGTMVAGLILGIAPEASILPIRVLDSDGRGDSLRIAAGIHRAVELGADVINLSLGSREDISIVDAAVQWAWTEGVVVVAAAGNTGTDEPILMPAGLGEAIAVTATDAEDIKASTASWGEHIALTAPGVAVVATFPGGAYRGADGTSLATALASGAAARIRGLRPTWSPDAVSDALADSATDIDHVNPDYAGGLGRGRLDVASALAALVAPADVNGDGVIGLADLIAVLAAWGPCEACPADVDGDGEVSFADLTTVLAAWG